MLNDGGLLRFLLDVGGEGIVVEERYRLSLFFVMFESRAFAVLSKVLSSRFSGWLWERLGLLMGWRV